MQRQPKQSRVFRIDEITQAAERLRSEHTSTAVRQRLKAQRSAPYLRDFIYGAVDGAVTTFAVVAGVAGAGLKSGIVIVLGVANLIADGFSMAVSNYLGTRAERQLRAEAQRQEEHHIRTVPDGEREEVRQILEAKGLRGSDLERGVDVITSNERLWVDTMMTEELGHAPMATNELRAASSTFAAFVVAGSVPLAAFALDSLAPGGVPQPFLFSAAMTGTTFFVVGALKSRFVNARWWTSGLETLAVGGAAATLAFLIGNVLEGLASG